MFVHCLSGALIVHHCPVGRRVGTSFAPGFGRDSVADFQAGQDVLEIDDAIFATIQGLLAHTVNDGLGNVVIAASANDVITLENVTKDALQQHLADLHLV